MRFVLAWFKVILKRILKNFIFLIMLLIMPISALFVSKTVESSEENVVKVGVMENNEAFEKKLINELLKQDETVLFSLFNDYDRLYNAVVTGEVSYGIVFKNSLIDSLKTGDYKKSIRVLVSRNNFFVPVIEEKVFSEIYKLYSEDIVKNYARKKFSVTQQQEKEILDLYEHYMHEGKTLKFEYETIKVKETASNKPEETEKSKGLPLKGIGAVIMLIGAAVSSIMWADDREKGIFRTLPPEKMLQVNMIYSFVFNLLLGVSVFASVGIAEPSQEPLRELIYMIFYILGNIGASLILNTLFKRSIYICMLLPVLIILNLVFTTIFINISEYFKVFEYIEKIFYINWYIGAAQDSFGFVISSVCILFCGIIGKMLFKNKFI